MNQSSDMWIPVVAIGLTVGPVVLILGYFFWINNNSDTREMRAVLFESKPYDIRSVTINSDESSKVRASLVAESISVTDAKTVGEVMDALATAVEDNPGSGKSREWVAMLRVVHAKREVNVEVICHPGEGVWLYLKSNGVSGWNLGTYHCRALGPVLERIAGHVRKAEEPDSHVNAPEIPIPIESEPAK